MWTYRRLVIAMLAIYWLTLVIATHYPLQSVPFLFSYQDKVIHTIAYGVFTTLLWWTLQLGPWRTLPWLVGFVVAGLGLHAAMDEYTQQFFRGRFPDVFDFCADMLGVLVAIPLADAAYKWATSARMVYR